MSRRVSSERLTLIAGAAVTAAAVLLAVWGWRAGIFRSTDALRAFVSRFGWLGPLLLIVLHVVQVVVPFLPGAVTLAAGVLAFGPWWGFAWNYAGSLLGSLLAFLLAKRCGRPLVRRLTPRALCEKYLDRPLPPRFERLFALAILLPGAPDDTLCMVAGLSGMRTRRFFLILAAMKPLSIFFYSLSLLLLGHLIF